MYFFISLNPIDISSDYIWFSNLFQEKVNKGPNPQHQSAFNESVIKTVENNPKLINTVFNPSNMDSCSVMLFAPLWDSNEVIHCKYHPDTRLTDGGRWLTDDRCRSLYDLHRKVILISRQVNCDKCSFPYKSHDDHILQNLPVSLAPPFILTHKEGITSQAADLVWNCAANGESLIYIDQLSLSCAVLNFRLIPHPTPYPWSNLSGWHILLNFFADIPGMLIHYLLTILNFFFVCQSVSLLTSQLKLDKYRNICSSGWDIFLNIFGYISAILVH